MKLEHMHIRPFYSYEEGFKEGFYRGEIKFTGTNGTVMINLTPAVAGRILAVVADDLVVASREIATQLTAEVFDHARLASPALEAQTQGSEDTKTPGVPIDERTS